MYTYTYTLYRAITPGQICLLQKFVCAKEVIFVPLLHIPQMRYLSTLCYMPTTCRSSETLKTWCSCLTSKDMFVQKRSYLCPFCTYLKRGICWLFAGRLCKRASIVSIHSSCRSTFVQKGYSSAKQIYFCRNNSLLKKRNSQTILSWKKGIHIQQNSLSREFTKQDIWR